MNLPVIAISAGISIALLTWVVLGPKTAPTNIPTTAGLLFPGLASPKSSDALKQLIVQAGSPPGTTPQTITTQKLTGAIVGALIALGVTLTGLIPYFLLTVPALAAIGYFYPTYKLTKARTKRIRDCSIQLPEALDLLRVEMSTGDNLVPALKDISQKAPPGTVRNELHLVVDDLAAGRSLADSLKGLAARLPTPEVDSFTRSVIQAERLGADVATTLSAQATAARTSREARIDKKISGLQNSLVLPMFANVAAIMLLLLAPSLVEILNVLG